MKKNFVVIAIVAFLGLSLLLAACGATAPTNQSSTGQVPTVVPTSAPATGSTTTPPAGNTSGTVPVRPNPSERPGNGNVDRQQIENATPETIVKRFYSEIKAGEMRSVLVLTTENFRQSFKDSNRNQIATALGLKPGQTVQDVQVGTSSINGDKATLTVTLTLSDSTKVTQNLTMVKGEVSRPNGQGQGLKLWQIDGIKVA